MLISKTFTYFLFLNVNSKNAVKLTCENSWNSVLLRCIPLSLEKLKSHRGGELKYAYDLTLTHSPEIDKKLDDNFELSLLNTVA